MYRHRYTCQKCAKILTIHHESPVNPLFRQLVTHGDIYRGGEQTAERPNISNIIEGITQNCPGALIYKDIETVVGAAPAPLPPPPTPQSICQEFCRGQQEQSTNTICAAVDQTDPLIRRKKGINAHGKALGTLHDDLQRILSHSDHIEGWAITNCAEVDAVDKLLKAGCQLGNIRVSTCDNRGQPKPPCENCRNWLISVSIGVYKVR